MPSKRNTCCRRVGAPSRSDFRMAAAKGGHADAGRDRRPEWLRQEIRVVPQTRVVPHRSSHMISRRLVLAAACLVAILPSTGAFSFESQPFTPQAFETAQQSGNQILVEIHAPWCPICKAQGPILSDLLADAKRKDMKVFRIDFDSQKADVRKLRAQSQSTLIV